MILKKRRRFGGDRPCEATTFQQLGTAEAQGGRPRALWDPMQVRVSGDRPFVVTYDDPNHDRLRDSVIDVLIGTTVSTPQETACCGHRTERGHNPELPGLPPEASFPHNWRQ